MYRQVEGLTAAKEVSYPIVEMRVIANACTKRHVSAKASLNDDLD